MESKMSSQGILYNLKATLAICLLVGCTSAPTIPETVNIPVRVSCIDQLPEKPKLHTDAEIKAMPDYEAIMTLLADRVEDAIYRGQMEAVMEGCRS
jgi:hypothetical protein